MFMPSIRSIILIALVMLLLFFFYLQIQVVRKDEGPQTKMSSHVQQVIHIRQFVSKPRLVLGEIPLDIWRKETATQLLPGGTIAGSIAGIFSSELERNIENAAASQAEFLIHAPCRIIVSLPVTDDSWQLTRRAALLEAVVPRPQFRLEIDYDELEVYRLREDIWISGEKYRQQLRDRAGSYLKSTIAREFTTIWKKHRERFRREAAATLMQLFHKLGIDTIRIRFDDEAEQQLAFTYLFSTPPKR